MVNVNMIANPARSHVNVKTEINNMSMNGAHHICSDTITHSV